MADPEPPASGAAADLESKEIWGDEADQLDEEIMKVQALVRSSRLQQQCFAFRLQPQAVRLYLYRRQCGKSPWIATLFDLIP